jgi:Flp pilus assembly pilin Flp
VQQVWRAVRGVCSDASGGTGAEYALLLGIVGGSLALAAFTLGDSIACSIGTSASVVAGQDGPSGHQYGHSDPQGLAKGHRPTC